MKFFWILLILTLGHSDETAAQATRSSEELAEHLKNLLRTPSTAQPAFCNEEEYVFDRVNLRKGRLKLLKKINFDLSESDITFTINLHRLSTEKYQIGIGDCYTEIILFSKSDKAFEFDETKYIADRLQEKNRYLTSKIRIKVFKNSGQEVIETLYNLAALYQ